MIISELDNTELCPLGYVIGENGMSIPWDRAISSGKWEEVDKTTIGINIQTLIRNAMESYDSDTPQSHLSARVREDITFLRQYFEDVHNSSVHVYGIRYDDLDIAQLPNYRHPKTDKQKAGAKIASEALRDLDRDAVDRWYGSRVSTDCKYLMTHILYDMAMASTSTKLISSYTGEIRNYMDCSTKLNLTDGERYTVPFNVLTYMMYGDKQLLNKNVSITKKLEKVLNTAKITPLSTESRLTMSIKNFDPLLYKYIRNIIK